MKEKFIFQLAVQKKEGNPENYLIRAENAINALLNAQAYFSERSIPCAIVAVVPTDITDFISDEAQAMKLQTSEKEVEEGQEKSEDLTIVG